MSVKSCVCVTVFCVCVHLTQVNSELELAWNCSSMQSPLIYLLNNVVVKSRPEITWKHFSNVSNGFRLSGCCGNMNHVRTIFVCASSAALESCILADWLADIAFHRTHVEQVQPSCYHLHLSKRWERWGRVGRTAEHRVQRHKNHSFIKGICWFYK